MKFVSISDVHIKKDNDSSCIKFCRFLKDKKTLEADFVILLGDIFDFLVGGHKQYISKFSTSIKAIVELSQTKKILYIEGNHDFHLHHLVEEMNKVGLKSENFELLRSQKILEDQERRIYIGHGDELEIDNYGHRLFKAIVANKFMSKISHLIPYKLLSTTGENASGASRRLNDYYYSDEEAARIKERYHLYAKTISDKQKVNVVICGHSHVKDYFRSETFEFVNNGYFPKSLCFIAYESGKITLENIN